MSIYYWNNIFLFKKIFLSSCFKNKKKKKYFSWNWIMKPDNLHQWSNYFKVFKYNLSIFLSISWIHVYFSKRFQKDHGLKKWFIERIETLYVLILNNWWFQNLNSEKKCFHLKILYSSYVQVSLTVSGAVLDLQRMSNVILCQKITAFWQRKWLKQQNVFCWVHFGCFK